MMKLALSSIVSTGAPGGTLTFTRTRHEPNYCGDRTAPVTRGLLNITQQDDLTRLDLELLGSLNNEDVK